MSSIWNRRANKSGGADPAPQEEVAEVARMLRPAQGQSETHRAAVLGRLRRSMSPVGRREDAGSLDGADGTTTTTHQVGHPDVGTIYMSDIEAVDAARMAKVTEQVAQFLNRVSDTEGGAR